MCGIMAALKQYSACSGRCAHQFFLNPPHMQVLVNILSAAPSHLAISATKFHDADFVLIISSQEVLAGAAQWPAGVSACCAWRTCT